MKSLKKQQALLKKGSFILSWVLLILFLPGCQKHYDNPTPKVTTVATGLMGPMGIETDWHGNVWIAETGTAMDDGKIVVVPSPKWGNQKSQTVYDAIINLSSIHNAQSGEVEGPSHLLFDNGMLYILAGDYLYKANVSSFKPGDKPIDATTLSREDIGTYVRSQNIVTPNDSHPYDLVKGPDGSLYITDAGANAIIKRTPKGDYSIFAKFPDIKNPLPGPPFMQSVPTGIIFDGHNFLVSTLTGYPFAANQAVIYQVSLLGKVSVYAKGFTTLVGIAQGNSYGHVVLHYGDFTNDFVPNSGSLAFANANSTTIIADGLNMPSGLKQIDQQSWYVTSLPEGTLLKVTYKY